MNDYEERLLDELSERGVEEGLDAYELEFVCDLDANRRHVDLSEAQREFLEKLHAKFC